MTAAIETSQLSKTFPPLKNWWQKEETRAVTAVQDVTFDVAAGELFGLLGPNGAGKSTLVKMLCTLIPPSSGQASVAGYPLSESARIKATVGLVVSDERSFYWRLSARRNLTFFAALYGLSGKAAAERITAVLTAVGLTEVANRPFSHYSTGMRQRLAIARALLHEPSILFLDEPSRSLDPIATLALHELIAQLRAERQMTILLITHDLGEAEKLCDRVALLHQGQIRTVGQPGDLRRQLRPHYDYEIIVGVEFEEIRQSIQNQFPMIEVANSKIRLQAGDDSLLTAVLGYLQQHEVPIHHIESTPSTLEEVFAHFTASDEPAAQAAFSQKNQT